MFKMSATSDDLQISLLESVESLKCSPSYPIEEFHIWYESMEHRVVDRDYVWFGHYISLCLLSKNKRLNQAKSVWFFQLRRWLTENHNSLTGSGATSDYMWLGADDLLGFSSFSCSLFVWNHYWDSWRWNFALSLWPDQGLIFIWQQKWWGVLHLVEFVCQKQKECRPRGQSPEGHRERWAASGNLHFWCSQTEFFH